MNSFSVADAIRYFSGLQIKDYGGVGGLKTVNIRSMGTNHMGVYYNGIQLGNAQNGQVDLGKFSLENIEENACVFDSDNDKIILFYCGRKIEDSMVRECISSKLPQYFMPDKFVKLRQMPHNQNGKIDRKNLKTLIKEN